MPFELIVFEIDDGRSTNAAAAAAYRTDYRLVAAATAALCMVFCCFFFLIGPREIFIPNGQVDVSGILAFGGRKNFGILSMDGVAYACAKCSPTDLNNKTHLRSESRDLSLFSPRSLACREDNDFVCVFCKFIIVLFCSFILFICLCVELLPIHYLPTFLSFFFRSNMLASAAPKIYSNIHFMFIQNPIHFILLLLLGHLKPPYSVRMKCIEDKFIEV